jgi:hypothetical protein
MESFIYLFLSFQQRKLHVRIAKERINIVASHFWSCCIVSVNNLHYQSEVHNNCQLCNNNSLKVIMSILLTDRISLVKLFQTVKARIKQ